MSLWSVETKAGIAVATYRYPPMNYFCAAGVGELGALIESWRDAAMRAVVLTGGIAGKFITHYSVEELASDAENRQALRAAGTTLNAEYLQMLRDLRDLPKPVIAAMNGNTMAAASSSRFVAISGSARRATTATASRR